MVRQAMKRRDLMQTLTRLERLGQTMREDGERGWRPPLIAARGQEIEALAGVAMRQLARLEEEDA